MVWLVLVLSLSAFGTGQTPTSPKKTAPAKIAPKGTHAEADAEVIKRGTPITVNEYDEKAKAFLITINPTPDHGPNYAEPEALRKAIHFEGDLKAFLNQRGQMNESVYTLNEDLPLLADLEVERRQKSAH